MTCKNCIHYEVCRDFQGSWIVIEHINKNDAEKKCEHFEDKSRIIELPCNVGETLYILNQGNQPQKMILDAPDIRCHCAIEDNLCMALCNDTKHNICAYRLMNDSSDIGKNVFLSKEESEAKLKELNENENA